MAYISMISAGGGLRALAAKFVVAMASAPGAQSAAATAATANQTNAAESAKGAVANVWA